MPKCAKSSLRILQETQNHLSLDRGNLQFAEKYNLRGSRSFARFIERYPLLMNFININFNQLLEVAAILLVDNIQTNRLIERLLVENDYQKSSCQ